MEVTFLNNQEDSMKKKALYLLAITFMSTSMVTTAVAGAKFNLPVFIGSSFFQGSIGSTRNSPDTLQTIGCSDFGTFAFCSATNASGTFRSCSTSSAAHLATIRGIGDSSFIRVDQSGGSCTGIRVEHNSTYAPKVN